MKKVFIISLITVSIFICRSTILHAQQVSESDKPISFPSVDGLKQAEIIYKLLPSANNTWGYDIFANNKIIIHQLTIPGMPGTEGFKKESQARDVAKLILEKMKRGEMPPSITIEEMKKISAL